MSKIISIITIVLLSSICFGITLTNTSSNIENYKKGCVSWVDFDNDGFIDLCVSGARNQESTTIETGLYQNSNAELTSIVSNISGSILGKHTWFDYDNDGDLDLFINGLSQIDPTDVYISQLYINEKGSINVLDTPIIDFVGESHFIDYDNDGDSDLLVMGYTNDEYYNTVLYENTDNGFIQSSIDFEQLQTGSILVFDYNNDSLIDIVVTGLDSSTNFRAIIYENTGNGFNPIDNVLNGVRYSSLCHGDFNNDGYQDILLTGLKPDAQSISTVYMNLTGTFVDLSMDLPGAFFGDCEWGDFDNDSDLDCAISGDQYWNSPYETFTSLFSNDSSLLDETTISLYQLSNCSLEWCDYDNDSDLDIVLTGTSSNNIPITRVYRNEDTPTNNVPTPPTNLSISEEGEYFKFEWDMGTDIEQPDISLTYEVRIGSTPGGCDIVSPMALPDGRALRPVFGRINSNCFYLIKSSVFDENETYYWSCQSIDNSFARSTFAEEQSFTY